MLLMNTTMTSYMLTTLYRPDTTPVFGAVKNSHMRTLIYTGGDLSGPELTSFENAPVSSGNTYGRDYSSTVTLLGSNRTKLVDVDSISKLMNLGQTTDKPVWRLSLTSQLPAVANGIAGLLVIFLGRNAGQSASLARAAFTFTLGAAGSGADIELTQTNFSTGNLINLNDIVIDFDGLM